VSQAQDQGIADSESDGQMRAAAALLEHQGKIKKSLSQASVGRWFFFLTYCVSVPLW
jgi:hypothetical protein